MCLKLQRPCDEIKNIIPWGFVGSRFYPDFKFATFKDGTPVMAETKKTWLKNELPQVSSFFILIKNLTLFYLFLLIPLI